MAFKSHVLQISELKPRSQGSQPEPDTGQDGVIDPVEDMFNVLEGSALIPFIEVNIKLCLCIQNFQFFQYFV
jgi:hypothetical protein